MDEPSSEPLTTWRSIRVNGVRIVIGVVLVAVVSVAVFVWMPYQREQRIAREIESHGGQVSSKYAGPDWMPRLIRKLPSYLDRIQSVDLSNTQVTDSGLEHLKTLNNLKVLGLNDTPVTDAGLEYLKGLTNLANLGLVYTQVTDAGLENLKGMTSVEVLMFDHTAITDSGLETLKSLTSLRVLHLDDTKTTPTGREKLRMALPSCKITPDP